MVVPATLHGAKDGLMLLSTWAGIIHYLEGLLVKNIYQFIK